jgi:NAD(P)-dependent dehydrogenase (short-subunit alcohol dehydrogenase family)
MTVQLDVTDERSVREAVEAAEQRFGRIDVLVNNAGYGLIGGIEEVNAQEARSLFATNVEGMLNVLRAALPGMRKRRSGNIVNISSLGGFSASAGWGVYNATKFAVEGLSEALALEVAPLGIAVTIVEPGYFRTDFLTNASLGRAERIIGDYHESLSGLSNRMVQLSGKQPGDPALAAKAIVDMIHSGNAPLRLALGSDAFDRIAAKLDSMRQNLQQWESLTRSTSFKV